MKILFTICGRAGSKGLSNKNLKEFLGQPLPFYTLSAIDLYIKQNPNMCCDIVLNTDSEKLINLVKRNIEIKVDIIKRESDLSGDNIAKIDVISSSFKIMKERKKRDYDMIVDLDITSPLRTVYDLSNLINRKINIDVDVVFSVTDSRRNPYFNMVKKENDNYVRVIESSFNARQEAPEIFDMNASMYSYSPSFLDSGKGIFEGKCDVIKMIDTAVLDIDSENDFELMQVIASYLYGVNNEMGKIKKNIKNILIDNK